MVAGEAEGEKEIDGDADADAASAAVGDTGPDADTGTCFAVPEPAGVTLHAMTAAAQTAATAAAATAGRRRTRRNRAFDLCSMLPGSSVVGGAA